VCTECIKVWEYDSAHCAVFDVDPRVDLLTSETVVVITGKVVVLGTVVVSGEVPVVPVANK
jgi:hypothetical protein